MKLRQITFGLVSSLAFSGAVFGHGMGHFHGNDADELDQPTPATSHEHTHEAGGKKHVHLEEREPRQWGVSFNTGWESRHVHYGVDETGVGGAYTNEINVNFYNFTFGVWNGIGTGNEFLEWDFTAAYTVDLDWVFVTPGYNFRYSPGIVEAGHGGHDDHGEEHDHDHDHDHEEEGHGHDHKEYGHELFIVLGTTKIPYVTPTVGFLWDLNNNPGGLLEFRLNGDIPVWKKVLSLQPYALMGLNFGYNTKDYYGWNNFQFGVQATWSVMKYIDVYAGINYSVAMEALRTIDQGNVVWANVGLSFNY